MPRWIVLCSSILLVLCGSQIVESGPFQAYVYLLSQGSIDYGPKVDVKVNISQVIGINNLSLGLQLDWEWKSWLDSPARRDLAKNANLKIIRFFDFRSTTPRLMPCTQWDEALQVGTWNWISVDSFVQAIFDIGAEPLICFGWPMVNSTKTQNTIPPGMAIDTTTQLPYPDSYAKYCAEWVKHFKQRGWTVRFYEIFNEPFGYFDSTNLTKLAYLMNVWNVCATAMRTENPTILISSDCITSKTVLNYWLANNPENVDFLSFHKYDCWATEGTGYFDDTELLLRAERVGFETTWTFGVDDARQIWFNSRHVVLPVICSESNLNSAYQDGTDPRIQKTVGAIWTALVLREAILKGLSYYIYYNFYSGCIDVGKSGGIGFGMIDFDTDRPWYPYYVYQMIGKNLAPGDEIVESTSDSNDVRTLAWIHDRTLNLLVISKVDNRKQVYVSAGTRDDMRVTKIDNNIPWEKASLQTYLLNTTEPLIISGYAVALLQAIQ